MFGKKSFVFLVLLLLSGIFLYYEFNHPRFGVDPKGQRLARIEKSPNYKNGAFVNADPEPTNLVKENFFVRMYNIHVAKDGARVPNEPIPTAKTDLKALDPKSNVVIPLGHSSFFIQLDGMRMLVDPVFLDYAGPFSFINRAFEGSVIYSLDDMPPIDYVFISHDHYDHLEYETMLALRGKVDKVITTLGLGAYFELWGYAPEDIWEGDWFDSLSLKNGIELTITPSRHYSSRLKSRNKTLWAGMALISPSAKIYYSSDTGYGSHIAKIAEKFNDFDLAILDVGQFNPLGWPHIHFLPEHAAKAAEEIGAKRVFPAHNSKFAIALHDWKMPLEELTKASQGKNYKLLTPLIGEAIDLDNPKQTFEQWWKNVK